MTIGGRSPLHTQDPNFNAQQCQYYVFQLVSKEKTVEYVVEGYLPFKYITAAFEDLISQKDSLAKINSRIAIHDVSQSEYEQEGQDEE